MKDKDLLRIMAATATVVFLIANRFPEGAMYIALGGWGIVLFFDWLDNKGKSVMEVLDG